MPGHAALEAALKTTCSPSPNDVGCEGDLSGGIYSGCPSLVQVTQFDFIPQQTNKVKQKNPYSKYHIKKKTKIPTGLKIVPVAPAADLRSIQEFSSTNPTTNPQPFFPVPQLQVEPASFHP